MKKLVIAFILIMLPSLSYAGTLSQPAALSSDAGVTYNWLNDLRNNIFNDYNSNIGSGNIANGSIASDDIATAASPLVRDFNNIGEYVYSGVTIPTSANLTSTTTAGTSFIANDGDSTLHRVVTAATSKTYTASKDTYVFLDYNGAFSYDAQANGATQPTTPSNSIIIAKVVTDADNITSVTDLRSTSPANLRIYQDYIAGCVISRDVTTATKISIDVGEMEFGSATGKIRRNTSPVYVDLSTTGRGGLDTGSQAVTTYYYIFAVADNDNSSNFEGIASTSKTDASGVTGEELIGWCYSISTTTISPDSIGAYKGKGSSAPNIAHRSASDTLSLTSTAPIAIPGLETKFFSSGRPVQVTFKISGTADTDRIITTSISVDSAINLYTETKEEVATAGGSAKNSSLFHLNEGTHDIVVKYQVNAGTFTANAREIVVEEK